jgi:hypothetical protein
MQFDRRYARWKSAERVSVLQRYLLFASTRLLATQLLELMCRLVTVMLRLASAAIRCTKYGFQIGPQRCGIRDQ